MDGGLGSYNKINRSNVSIDIMLSFFLSFDGHPHPTQHAVLRSRFMIPKQLCAAILRQA